MNATCEFTTDTKTLKAAIDQIRPILKINDKQLPSASVEMWFNRNRFGFVTASQGYEKTIWTTSFNAEGGIGFRVQMRSDSLFKLPIPKGRAVPVSVEVVDDLAGKADRVKIEINGATRYLLCSDRQDSTFEDLVDKKEGERSAVTFKAADLLNALMATKHSMAVKDVRYYLNGTLIEQTSTSSARLVSTDGHRLTIFDLHTRSDFADTSILEKSIIERDDCLHLIDLLKNQPEDGEITITRNGTLVRFLIVGNGRDTCFVSKVIDGRYPDWERVVNQDMDSSVEIDRTKMLEALAAIKMPKDPSIKMEIGIEEITLTANPLAKDDEESSFVTIPVLNHDEIIPAASMYFSQKYITDTMKSAFTEDFVEIRFKRDVKARHEINREVEGWYYDESVNFVAGTKTHVLMGQRF